MKKTYMFITGLSFILWLHVFRYIIVEALYMKYIKTIGIIFGINILLLIFLEIFSKLVHGKIQENVSMFTLAIVLFLSCIAMINIMLMHYDVADNHLLLFLLWIITSVIGVGGLVSLTVKG